jgi:hypothetical protein
VQGGRRIRGMAFKKAGSAKRKDSANVKRNPKFESSDEKPCPVPAVR